MLEFFAGYWFLCVIGLLALVFVGKGLAQQRRRSRVQAELADREPYSSERFAETFFADSREKQWVARQLCEFVAENSFVDVSRIRPDDRLKKLGIRIADDPQLTWSLEARFSLHFGGADFEQMANTDREIETFEELVDALIAAKHEPWPIEVESENVC